MKQVGICRTAERRIRRAIVGLVLCAPCALAATPQPWAFVVSVGGIKVGDPVEANGAWTLPVQADVSGLETFTAKPTVLNSARVCARVAAEIVDNSIYLTIHSDLAGVTKSARCPPAQLGAISPGKYKIFYKGPQDAPILLRSVNVGL
jgi:hypothetical protein